MLCWVFGSSTDIVQYYCPHQGYQSNYALLNFLLAGLSEIEAVKYEPEICSKRVCEYNANNLHSSWVSYQVMD